MVWTDQLPLQKSLTDFLFLLQTNQTDTDDFQTDKWALLECVERSGMLQLAYIGFWVW